MKQWNEIFKERGKVFLKPHEDMGRVVKAFKESGVKTVLDLGCGTGRHLVYLAKRGFRVYGFDIASDGIRIAKVWLKKEKLHASFQVGSIYKRFPYQSNYFDALISTNTIHHSRINNIRKAIHEAERVLKSGGLIFITVRKRKLRKFYPKGTIIEKYGKQRSSYKIIGPRTFAPIEGGEKGLVHYLFNKAEIKKEFKNFKFHDIWVDSPGMHYCFLAELKN